MWLDWNGWDDIIVAEQGGGLILKPEAKSKSVQRGLKSYPQPYAKKPPYELYLSIGILKLFRVGAKISRQLDAYRVQDSRVAMMSWIREEVFG